VIAIHAVRAYRDFYDHVRGWDGEILFLPPQLAALVATALALSGTVRVVSAHDAVDPFATMRVRGMLVLVTAMSLLALGFEFFAIATPEADFTMGLVLLVAGTLHLLAAGLAADTFGAAARRLPTIALPAARVRSAHR